MSTPAGSGAPARSSVSGAIALALILSQAIYALVAWLVVRDGWQPLAGPAASLVGPVAAVMAVGLLVLSWVLPPRLRSSGDAKGSPLGAHVMAQAARESVGVLGLVATLLTGELLWVVVLAAVASGALLVGWLREVTGAGPA